MEARHVRGGRITCAGAAPHEPAIYRDLFRRDNRERTVPRIEYRSARKPEHKSTDAAQQKLPTKLTLDRDRVYPVVRIYLRHGEIHSFSYVLSA